MSLTLLPPSGRARSNGINSIGEEESSCRESVFILFIYFFLLAHLSIKCSRRAIVISQSLSSVVHCASTVMRVNNSHLMSTPLIPHRPIDSKLGRKHLGDLYIKKTKIVPTGNSTKKITQLILLNIF